MILCHAQNSRYQHGPRLQATLQDLQIRSQSPWASSGPWSEVWPLAIAQVWTSPWTPLANSPLISACFSSISPLQIGVSPYPMTDCLSLSLPFHYPVLSHHDGAWMPSARILSPAKGSPMHGTELLLFFFYILWPGNHWECVVSWCPRCLLEWAISVLHLPGLVSAKSLLNDILKKNNKNPPKPTFIFPSYSYKT